MGGSVLQRRGRQTLACWHGRRAGTPPAGPRHPQAPSCPRLQLPLTIHLSPAPYAANTPLFYVRKAAQGRSEATIAGEWRQQPLASRCAGSFAQVAVQGTTLAGSETSYICSECYSPLSAPSSL